MLLYVVAFQFRFPWMDDAARAHASDIPRFECEDWTTQNVRRRVQSALAYLDWQSHKYRADRWSAERWHYLAGRRLLHDTFFASPARLRPELVPFSIFPAQIDSGVASWSRGKLVDALCAANPAPTDRALLSRLSRRKLETMLAEAWETAGERRSA